MSQVVPPVLVTVRTGIQVGPAAGTSWDVPSSPNISWDCQDITNLLFNEITVISS